MLSTPPCSTSLSLLLDRFSPCISYFVVLCNFLVKILPVGIRVPISEGSDCALVVTGAYDRHIRLWDISTTTSVGGRANLLGTLSGKVRARKTKNSRMTS